jgi:hypothetical protein
MLLLVLAGMEVVVLVVQEVGCQDLPGLLILVAVLVVDLQIMVQELLVVVVL